MKMRIKRTRNESPTSPTPSSLPAEVSNLCRLCMGKGRKKLTALTERFHQRKSIADIVKQCVPQLVLERSSHKLPEWICARCLRELKIVYEFQSRCVETEKQWRLQLGESVEAVIDANVREQEQHIKEDPLEQETKEEIVEELEELEDTKELIEEEHIISIECAPEELELLDDSPVAVAEADGGSHDCDEANASDDYLEDERDITESPTSQTETTTPADADRKDSPKVHSSCFECSLCQQQFNTKKQLLIHRLTHERGGNSKSKQFQLTNEANGRYKCPYCSRRFTLQKSCIKHQASHHSNKADFYTCEVCGKIYKTVQLFYTHLRKNPDHRIYKCSECRREFGCRELMEQHAAMHAKAKGPFICEHCNSEFKIKTQLYNHMRKHISERSYLCSECGKSFNSSSSLNQHVALHQEKSFKCTYCPSAFHTKGALKKHLCTHSGARKFVCDECGKDFTRPDTLKKHKMIHTGKRPYKCEECNMTFVFRGILSRHMRTHTGEKPYVCKFCGRAYAESGDLNKHLRLHLGELIYRCNECPEGFKYLSELRVHRVEHYKRKQENGEIPTEEKSAEAIAKEQKEEPVKIEENDLAEYLEM